MGLWSCFGFLTRSSPNSNPLYGQCTWIVECNQTELLWNRTLRPGIMAQIKLDLLGLSIGDNFKAERLACVGWTPHKGSPKFMISRAVTCVSTGLGRIGNFNACERWSPRYFGDINVWV